MPTSRREQSPQEVAAPRCRCNRCRAHDAGTFGPYTTSDFVRLFGYANEPEPVEVPAELAALGIEVDAAQSRYEPARDEWAVATRRAAEAEAVLSRHTGTPSAAERVALESAQDEVAAAKTEVDEAGEVLASARVAYNALARQLGDQKRAEDYRADLAAQAAAREAARQEARSRAERRGLRRIRASVRR